MSRWKASSAWRSRSRRCRRKSLRKRRCMISTCLSGQHALDGARKAGPGGLVLLDQFAAVPGDFVVLGFAVVLGQSPFRRDGAIELQAVEGGVERAFLDGQHVVGEQMDGLSDSVAMHGAALEGVQDEQVEGALKE